MKKSESLASIGAALAQFQANMPTVPKLHHAEIPTKSGGSYSYAYADLGDAVEASRPKLAEAGLSVTQWIGHEEGHVLTTLVLHTSGEWLEDTMRLLIPEQALSPQVQGSAVTYARRYAYCAALGIVADIDDDGTLAQMAYAEGSKRQQRNAPKTPSSRPKPVQQKPSDPQGKIANTTINNIRRELAKKGITKEPDIAVECEPMLGHEVLDIHDLTEDEGMKVLAKLVL